MLGPSRSPWTSTLGLLGRQVGRGPRAGGAGLGPVEAVEGGGQRGERGGAAGRRAGHEIGELAGVDGVKRGGDLADVVPRPDRALTAGAEVELDAADEALDQHGLAVEVDDGQRRRHQERQRHVLQPREQVVGAADPLVARRVATAAGQGDDVGVRGVGVDAAEVDGGGERVGGQAVADRHHPADLDLGGPAEPGGARGLVRRAGARREYRPTPGGRQPPCSSAAISRNACGVSLRTAYRAIIVTSRSGRNRLRAISW